MRHNGFSLFVSIARTSSLRPPATSEVVNPPYKAVKAVLFSISKLERQLWNHSHPWFTCNEENDTDTAGPERLNYTGVFLYLVPTFLCQASWGRCVIGRVAVLVTNLQWCFKWCFWDQANVQRLPDHKLGFLLCYICVQLWAKHSFTHTKKNPLPLSSRHRYNPQFHIKNRAKKSHDCDGLLRCFASLENILSDNEVFVNTLVKSFSDLCITSAANDYQKSPTVCTC